MRQVNFYRMIFDEDKQVYTKGRALLVVNPEHVAAIEDNGETETCDLIMCNGIGYRVQIHFDAACDRLARE